MRPLQGTTPRTFRLRVGGFKVIFRFEDPDLIRIGSIEPRGQAYWPKRPPQSFHQ